MNLKLLYFYYDNKIQKPNIIEYVDEFNKYKELYNIDNDNLNKPLSIDEVFDVYNDRKKDYDNKLNCTDVYYLFVDFDNMEATNHLIYKTEKDKSFKGWITMGTKEYDRIHKIFMGTGNFEKALNKIKNKFKED